MKSTLVAALASLMLAGALSAVTMTVPRTSDGAALIVADGAAPVPTAAPGAAEDGGSSSHQ